MTTRRKVAAGLFVLIVALLCIAAAADLLMTTVPDHELRFLGRDMQTLDARTGELILIFTRMIGCWYIAVAIGIASQIEPAFRRGSRTALGVLAGLTLLPNAMIMATTYQLGFGPNLIAGGAILILALTGLALGYGPKAVQAESYPAAMLAK